MSIDHRFLAVISSGKPSGLPDEGLSILQMQRSIIQKPSVNADHIRRPVTERQTGEEFQVLPWHQIEEYLVTNADSLRDQSTSGPPDGR